MKILGLTPLGLQQGSPTCRNSGLAATLAYLSQILSGSVCPGSEPQGANLPPGTPVQTVNAGGPPGQEAVLWESSLGTCILKAPLKIL